MSSFLQVRCHQSFTARQATHQQLGFQSKQLIVEANLNLGDVDEYSSIDVTIDGADEWVSFLYSIPRPYPD